MLDNVVTKGLRIFMCVSLLVTCVMKCSLMLDKPVCAFMIKLIQPVYVNSSRLMIIIFICVHSRHNGVTFTYVDIEVINNV